MVKGGEELTFAVPLYEAGVVASEIAWISLGEGERCVDGITP